MLGAGCKYHCFSIRKYMFTQSHNFSLSSTFYEWIYIEFTREKFRNQRSPYTITMQVHIVHLKIIFKICKIRSDISRNECQARISLCNIDDDTKIIIGVETERYDFIKAISEVFEYFFVCRARSLNPSDLTMSSLEMCTSKWKPTVSSMPEIFLSDEVGFTIVSGRKWGLSFWALLHGAPHITHHRYTKDNIVSRCADEMREGFCISKDLF